MSKTKILVADDNDIFREFLIMALDERDCEVIAVKNGKEAIEETKKSMPQIVVLDIVMPVMDGIEAVGILKADPETRHIPVIMLTSYTDSDKIFKSRHSGADYYLPRSSAAEKIKKSLNHIINTIEKKKNNV